LLLCILILTISFENISCLEYKGLATNCLFYEYVFIRMYGSIVSVLVRTPGPYARTSALCPAVDKTASSCKARSIKLLLSSRVSSSFSPVRGLHLQVIHQTLLVVRHTFFFHELFLRRQEIAVELDIQGQPQESIHSMRFLFFLRFSFSVGITRFYLKSLVESGLLIA